MRTVAQNGEDTENKSIPVFLFGSINALLAEFLNDLIRFKVLCDFRNTLSKALGLAIVEGYIAAPANQRFSTLRILCCSSQSSR